MTDRHPTPAAARHLAPGALAPVLLLLLCAPVLPAQTPAPRPEPETGPPEWPQPAKKDAARAEELLNVLRKEDPEVRQKAADELVGFGLGIANRLFRRMSDEKHANINTELVGVLDRILEPAHAPLIALHAGHRSLFARRYVFKKLASYADSSTAPVLVAAGKDKDVEIRYYAALGRVKISADLDALDAVYERCLKEWALLGDEFARFMEGGRGPQFVPWLRQKLASKDSHERVTALRMMRSLAPKDAAVLVRRFLDSEVSIEKKEAINTLRVVVDGEEPLPLTKITVFLVIKMAKEWKARL
jgi:hypothetical protein